MLDGEIRQPHLVPDCHVERRARSVLRPYFCQYRRASAIVNDHVTTLVRRPARQVGL